MSMLTNSKIILVVISVVTIVIILASVHRYNDEEVEEKEEGKQQVALGWHLQNINATKCRNTIQGQTYITDERGFTCFRRDVGENGCCKVSEKHAEFLSTLSDVQAGAPLLLSCQGCNSNLKCCDSYEFCVSCCLRGDQKQWQQILEEEEDLAGVKDAFELCSSTCRTSSRSLIREREYKNSPHKYCYAANNPPAAS